MMNLLEYASTTNDRLTAKAVFSEDRSRRLRLDRFLDGWPAGVHAALIGVNPSIANEYENDATIRKDLGFAKRNGWSCITKINLFDFVATDVRELARADVPNSLENNVYLFRVMQEADIVVPCWGPPEKLPKRLQGEWRKVALWAANQRKPLYCIGTTKHGHPRHTLMTPYSTPVTLWNPPE